MEMMVWIPPECRKGRRGGCGWRGKGEGEEADHRNGGVGVHRRADVISARVGEKWQSLCEK